MLFDLWLRVQLVDDNYTRFRVCCRVNPPVPVIQDGRQRKGNQR